MGEDAVRSFRPSNEGVTNMKKDIQAHIDSCLQCQVRKKSTAKPTPLQPLPTTDQPNQRIHIDLFGPLKTSAQGNKMVLVMTDAFTKYAEAIAIPNKEAEFSNFIWVIRIDLELDGADNCFPLTAHVAYGNKIARGVTAQGIWGKGEVEVKTVTLSHTEAVDLDVRFSVLMK